MRVHAAGAALLLLVATAGCGTDQQVAPTGPAAGDLRVGLTDFAVTTRPGTAAAGDVRLTVTNAGATLHDLVVTGAEGRWRTPDLRPGESAVLHVQARAGERLVLLCSIAGHEAAGMHGALPVAGQAP